MRAAVAAAFGLAAFALAPPAHADVLVSNIGQIGERFDAFLDQDQAQAFTTGNYASSYTLTSVDIRFRNLESSDDFAVELWSESDGSPDSRLATLTVSGTRPTTGTYNIAFVAEGTGIELTRNTTYFVVVDVASGGRRGRLANTGSNHEDATSAAGWSVADGNLVRDHDSTGAWTSTERARKIRVNGTSSSTIGATLSSIAVTSTPALTWPGSTSPDTYGEGETIEVSVNMSEAVTVAGDPQLEFTLGSATRQADYVAGRPSDADTLVFRYTVQAGDRDDDGIWIGDHTTTFKLDADDTITTNSNDLFATLDHDAPGTQADHRVDPPPVATVESVAVTSTPSLRSMGAATPDTYGLDESIEISVTMSHAVTVTGHPQLAFTLGDAPRRAVYDATASTGRVLVFRYAVQAGDRDDDGIRIGDHTTTFRLDGDARIDIRGAPANLAHGAQGIQPGHKVDATRRATVGQDTGRVLVSNIGQRDSGTSNLNRYDFAQLFTVGESSTNPRLYAVEVEFNNLNANSNNLTLSIVSDRFASLATLEPPAHVMRTTGDGVLRFDVPGRNGLALTAGNNYLIFFDSTNARGNVRRAGSANEDDTGQTGWEINNSRHRRTDSSTSLRDFRSVSGALKIRLLGDPGTPVVGIESIEVTSTPTLIWPGSTAPDTYGPGEDIEFTVTFTGNVRVAGSPEFEFTIGANTRRAAYSAGDSSATTMVFKYRTQESDRAESGIHVGDHTTTFQLGRAGTFIAIASNADLNAILEHEALGTLSGHRVGTPPGVASVDSLTVTSTPLLTSTGATSPDTYGRAEAIELTAEFSEAVAVTGAPALEFSLGGGTRRAAWVESASDADTLVFRYAVQEGDVDADGIAVGNEPPAFRLGEGDAIRTVSNSYGADLAHDAVEAQSAHRVDGTRTAATTLASLEVTSTPLLTSPGATAPDTYGRGEDIELTATFPAAVTVTGTPEVAFTLGDATRRAAYVASASSATAAVFRYTVQAGDVDADGIHVGDHTATFLGDTDDRIRTANGALAILAHAAKGILAAHRADGARTVAATVASVSVTSRPLLRSASATDPDTYGEGDTIRFEVAFSEAVAVTGAPALVFTLGATPRQAAYTAGASDADTLVFTYTVQPGDVDADGIHVGDHTATFLGDTDEGIRTTANNRHAFLDHDPPGTLPGHRVRGTRTIAGAATVKSVAVISTPRLARPGVVTPDVYGRGETIVVAVTFSAEVEAEGTPQIEVSIGGSARLAAYAAADSSATALAFRYTVQAGDRAPAGVAVDARPSAFRLTARDRIRTRSLEEVLLDNDKPLDPQSGHRVDATRTAAAVLTSLEVISAPVLLGEGSTLPDTYGREENITFAATFTRAVTVTGAPTLAFTLGDAERQAAYDVGGSTAEVLLFRYTVQDTDLDADGIEVGDHTATFLGAAHDGILTAANDPVSRSASARQGRAANDVPAILGHDAKGTLSGHKVDGEKSAFTFVEPEWARQGHPVLISNLEQPSPHKGIVTRTDGTFFYSFRNHTRCQTSKSQVFATGPVESGYLVTGVQVVLSDNDVGSFALELCPQGEEGTASCTRLTAPDVFAAGTLTFDAPEEGILLAANEE